MFKHFLFLGVIAVGIVTLLNSSSLFGAGPSANFESYAWSPNYGWVSFHDDGTFPQYRVNVVNGTFTNGSYAWSPNVGWIAFGENQLAGCPQAPCIAEMIQEGNTRYLRGWAKVLSTGTWLALSGTTVSGEDHGVKFDASGAATSDSYAWDHDGVGWLMFKGVTTGGQDFGVYVDPISVDDINISDLSGQFGGGPGGGPGGGGGGGTTLDCAFYAEPSTVPDFGKTTLYWYCQNASSCSLGGTPASLPSGSTQKTLGKINQIYTLSCQGAGGPKDFTTEVKVSTSNIIETNPLRQ